MPKIPLGLMAETSGSVLLLMQRNAPSAARMAFGLGIQIGDDYGRAPKNEGLY
jgi:hypothetical protein